MVVDELEDILEQEDNFVIDHSITEPEEYKKILHNFNPTLHGGGPSWPTPQHLRLWSLLEYSEEPKILVQFLIHSDNCYAKCLEPKGFPKKNLEYIF